MNLILRFLAWLVPCNDAASLTRGSPGCYSKAPKGAGQASPASGGNRISALPNEILRHVLTFLPAGRADMRARPALATPLEVSPWTTHRRRRREGAGALRGGPGVCGQPLAPPWKLASGDI